MVSEVIVILLLILLNGLFALSEMAVVSARRNRLAQKAEDGQKGAVIAIELAENPNRFLSTVQIGITLIGILSGAFGGATIAGQIAAEINKLPLLAPYSEGIGVGLVVITITYFSLVLGELVPKRMALNNAEQLAAAVAPPMKTISRIATPFVSLLSGSTNLALRVLGVKLSSDPEVTEEDVRSMIDQGTESGVFEEIEQDMVERILRLGDRSISALMTPRPDMIFFDIDASHEKIQEIISRFPFARFPVIQDTPDHILGIVKSRDLLLQRVEGPHFDLAKAMQQPLFLPEATTALDVLEQFKTTGSEMAIVIDEYGGVLGLVSMNDILEAIVGDVITPGALHEAAAVRREDGSWLFDGMILADDVKKHLDLDELPGEREANYATLGGMIMSQLGRIPTSGDHLEWENIRFEVVDMDGRRVDKVLVTFLSQ